MQNCSLIRRCSHMLSLRNRLHTLRLSSRHVFPAQVPARAAEQAASPVEEAGVISQEQEEHRGGKHRHTGEQLKPRHVSRCSLCALCLSDFGPHSQPFFPWGGYFISRTILRTSFFGLIVLYLWRHMDLIFPLV